MKRNVHKNVEPNEDAQAIQEGEVLEESNEEDGMTMADQTYQELQKQLQDAQQQAEDNLDGWQRERADFSNYRKRLERDQMQMRQTITAEVIKQYLVILDDVERALQHRPADNEGHAWAKGIDLIAQKLKTILDQEGIVPVAEVGQEFDPTVHEAISSEESADVESGQIIEVMQQGYQMPDGRVLRPAMVRVAR